MSVRTERVSGEIKKALSAALLADHSGLTDSLITITQVRMSPDLRSGRVYVSLLGGTDDPEQVLTSLQTIAPRLRSAVGRAVRLKVTPELFWYLDDTEQEAQKIEEIFKKIRSERDSNASAS
jgi:ribosome-binding factor A